MVLAGWPSKTLPNHDVKSTRNPGEKSEFLGGEGQTLKKMQIFNKFEFSTPFTPRNSPLAVHSLSLMSCLACAKGQHQVYLEGKQRGRWDPRTR